MTTFKPLNPVTLDFFDTAPLRAQATMVANCTPDLLFETIRGGTETWRAWAPALRKVEWTSEKPYAQNATRDVTLAGGMVVRELFFHWVENERVAFYVTESDIPNLNAFAEDYRVERLGPNQIRLTWTVALENTGFMRYLNPVMSVLMTRVFESWLKKYKKLLEARAATTTPAHTDQSPAPPQRDGLRT